jgi:signal transduction histidine kinase
VATPTTPDEAARLRAVTDYLDVRPKTRRDLEALCEIAAVVCSVPVADVNLVDAENLYTLAAYGDVAGVGTRDDSMCSITMATGGDVVIRDASQDARYAGNPWVDGRLGDVRFYASCLLRTPAGHTLGTLCVYDDVPRELSPHRQSMLAKVAQQAADVLELQLQTARLEETLAELERSHSRLAAFAGQVSHDLKTPLTSVIGFAELLEDLPSVATDETARDYLNRCTSSGRRMLAMIDEMLAFARIGGTLNRVDIDLDEVLPAVLADLGPAAAAVGVSWGGDPVRADAAQLRALLQNLVGNAVAYRRPETESTVLVRATARLGGVELTVIDNGTSIPPERRAEVLAPLGRLRRDLPGSGLGLAICTRIAEAHGGSLRLGETPGGGTTVTVNLPV